MPNNDYFDFIKKYKEYENKKKLEGLLNCKEELDDLLFIKKKIEQKIYNYDIKNRIMSLFIFGMIKVDEASIYLEEKEYIKDLLWIEKEYDETDLEEIKNRLLAAIDYFNNVVRLYENNENEELVEFYTGSINKIRRCYQDLSYIYYINENDELFLRYSTIAVDYNSIGAASTLVKYYCDQDNYNLAKEYFKKCLSIKIENLEIKQNVVAYEQAKVLCYSHMYHYLYNKGHYQEAKKTVLELKNKYPEYYIYNLPEFSEDKIIGQVDEWIEECDKFIALANEKVSVEKEEKLKEYFSDEIIKNMSNEVKIYILTSLEINNYLDTQESIMDYSAALMPIMKAVEQILYTIIVENYLGFVRKKDNINISLLSKNFIYNDKIKDNIDRIVYEDVLYSIARYNYRVEQYVPNKYFLEYCNKNKMKNPEETIIFFAEKLYDIKQKRNKIAHKERIYKEDAVECKELLLDKIKFIEFLYNNFSFSFMDTLD